MEKSVTSSDFISKQNDLGAVSLIATHFLDLDDKEIFLWFEDGWYSDDAICFKIYLTEDLVRRFWKTSPSAIMSF